MSLPPRDHNAPPAPEPLSGDDVNSWLDYQGETLTSRRDEVLHAVNATLDSYAQIDDDYTLGIFAENQKMAASLKKLAEGRRVEAKEPFLNGGRAVDGWFGRLIDPLKSPLDAFQSRMNDYGRRKREAEEAKRREQARIAQEEADRKAHEAAQALRREQEADAARRASMPVPEPDFAATDEALRQAEDAALIAAEMQARANARAADMTRARGSYGAVASMRVTWRARVVNKALIPLEFMEPNMAALGAALRTAPKAPNGKPLIDVSGKVGAAGGRIDGAITLIAAPLHHLEEEAAVEGAGIDLEIIAKGVAVIKDVVVLKPRQKFRRHVEPRGQILIIVGVQRQKGDAARFQSRSGGEDVVR